MRVNNILTSAVLLIASSVAAQDSNIELRTAKNHAIQYYIAVPRQFTAKSVLPVVILFEAAEKEYKKNIERFVQARGDASFILVQPIHTNNGNQGRRDPALFPYSKETWDYIDKVGDCQFNADGIQAIYHEVKNEYHTEARWFATGFEAGTHMLWWMLFNHPEWIRAAAPVAGNYRGRCVDENAIAKDESRSLVPIRAFVGDQDEVWKPGGSNYNQWTTPRELASKAGHMDITEEVIKGKGHVTMEKEVLAYFRELATSN